MLRQPLLWFLRGVGLLFAVVAAVGFFGVITLRWLIEEVLHGE